MNKGKINKPPRLAELLFSIFLRAEDKEHRLGDLNESYEYIFAKEGKIKAVNWYWLQVIHSFPHFIINNLFWDTAMFKNYFKIAIRNFYKTKFYSGLNILGLAIGLSSCMLISIYVLSELNYDNFHKNADEIYRMNWDFNWNGNSGISSGTPPPLAATMVDEIPEIKSATRIYPVPQMVVRYEDKFFNEDKILGVDSNFFDFFSFQLIEGNPETALKEPGSVILTEETAAKYFGTVYALGKTITIGKDSKFIGRHYSSTFKVTGIVENTPKNSHIQFNMLTSINSHPQVGFFDWSWIWMQMTTYVTVDKNISTKDISINMKKMVEKHAPLTFKRIGFSYDEMIKNGGKWDFIFQPLNEVYLGSENIGNRIGPTGNKTYIYIFSIVAGFILLIACINYMNLSTARSLNRIKEIGVRKVLGSSRKNLMLQFMSEAILFSFTAIIIAGIITTLVIIPFENMASINFDETFFNFSWLAVLLILLTIAVGLIAGSYPSLFLSSFKPVDVLKGKSVSGNGNQNFRNILVVLQFTISIALIICTFVIFSQMQYLKNTNLGFDKNNILVVSNENHLLGDKADTFTEIIKTAHEVLDASVSTGIPPNSGFGDFYKAEGNGDEQFDLFSYMVDDNYIKTMGLELINGHGFSKDYGLNAEGVILNESAVKLFGWDNPIGKIITYPSKGDFKVIGIIKDFNFFSLHSPILPFALFHNSSKSYDISQSYIVAKISSGNISKTIDKIKEEWSKLAPGTPFSYSFLDETLDAQYKSEQRLGEIFIIFASLAILIACLGLLGLAAFTAEKRKKEIGVRKTLGATVYSVVILLTKDFTKWILISNIIAVPIAWYAMENWLQNFAYRISMGYWEFIAAGLTALIIAVITVSYQAVKAAVQNPADVIKYE